MQRCVNQTFAGTAIPRNMAIMYLKGWGDYFCSDSMSRGQLVLYVHGQPNSGFIGADCIEPSRLLQAECARMQRPSTVNTRESTHGDKETEREEHINTTSPSTSGHTKVSQSGTP